ncbi:uncharacterized protein LOC126734281 isoform X2 [Anthonomus grandis grandis]|uniref:uncharacterized protein LOC126734281 isoform X2 n=1 Tax=Anthonomus grandis grandis TaxID=2921223 RepID=UPI00216606A4|nr:uncharacterized protein LOC126734281 isoform X2 [Anthonomus grandis grandis]
MGRYLILKLGLAITFYAVYCLRPMLVYSLEADNEVDHSKVTQPNHEFFNYFQGVDGRPGIDFPVYSFIPRTSFSCRGIESGYYADLETDCQVFHICEDSRKISFLCPNGTIFQQSELICEWWNKVNCSNSPNLYEESAERLQNDVARRKLANRKVVPGGTNSQHGAIMRTEERSSVRVTQNGKNYPGRQQQRQSQRINNYRTPSNNDIEQIIEESESNNRYLANAQNNLVSNSQYDQLEQRHPNHNYNVDQNNRNSQRGRSKASKKDVDKETGNYLNTNYDKHVARNSKSSINKNSDQTQKDYYVQFGATNREAEAITETYQTTLNNFYSTSKKKENSFSNTRNSHESRSKTTYSTEPSTATYYDYSEERGSSNNVFGTRTTSRVKNNLFSSNIASTTTQATTTKQPYSVPSVTFIQSTTASLEETTTADPFAYGTAVKERFSSYDARKSSSKDKTLRKIDEIYQASLNNINNLNKFKVSTPITTYSPPIKSLNIGTTNSINYQDSGETQVPQESSSFVKSPFNSISEDTIKSSSSKPYPNHRSTYSDVQKLIHLEAPKVSAISSITPHLVTTQPINKGKPFVGSRVGSTILPNQKTTHSKYTYLPTTSPSTKPTVILGVLRHKSTTSLPPYGPLELHTNNFEQIEENDLFNTGNTDKVLPEVQTFAPLATNSLPTDIFNVGKPDTTLRPNILPDIENSSETDGSFESKRTELFNVGKVNHALLASITPKLETTTEPQFKISVPEQGSLNIYQGQEPVNEPPFVKKTVSLLYPGLSSTENSVDHATVYGRYVSSTARSSTKNTPYSPTVPTVTQSAFITSTTTRKPKEFTNQGIPVKFTNGQDKISIHLSKNVGGQSNEIPARGNAIQPLKIGAVLRFGDKQITTTIRPDGFKNGFYITKGFSEEVDDFSRVPVKSKLEKPRPFAKSLSFEQENNAGLSVNQPNINSNSFPPYQTSSARPFELNDVTSPTTFSKSSSSISNNAYENLDNMIGVLQEIANYNSKKNSDGENQSGFEIPPSVSPQTLHSLVQYFAHDLHQNDTINEVLEPDTKEKITTLLTAMTVHGYHNLFNVGLTSTPIPPTSPPQISSTEPTSIRFGGGNNESSVGDTTTTGEVELLPTTSIPELRQLARNFSLALSSYLNDPNTFRKSLEGLRPTEPPPLDGSDNIDSSTSEDELLNFSDADIKPSTPAAPSPTWGYILAAEASKAQQDEVKNSLNPDLHTADSQSFIPRFNKVQVEEKTTKAFTDLPVNHWTSNTAATKLWQKALSVNPAIVNDHFETTLSSIVLDDETTEPELFNAEILPKISEPLSEVKYDLRELPPLSLNATQVHGILIDFMNHTRSDEHNRLSRILKKLNTSEEEFLNRMQEIESNPLTKRLVLLLISECGANITQDLGLQSYKANSESSESQIVSASSSAATARSVHGASVENHSLGKLLSESLSEEDQDSRALQLLNSLYTIASRFGKKR